jgi:hypothetical protein
MSKPKKQPCRKRNGKQVSFDFKLSVIDEINNGRISVNYAANATKCKLNNGFITSSDRGIPGELLLSIARFRFTR